MGTFLVDGAVAGSWWYQENRVHTAPFEPLPHVLGREVDEEAARLSAFYR